MNEKEVPMVPKHQVESALAHMSRALRMVIVGFTIGFAMMVLMAAIFVTAYTSRTKEWLSTYAALRANPAITEVANGQQADP